jgi:hypothetical protein
MTGNEYYTAPELQALTGIPASTWRWWACYHPERGPAATKIGRRLVWRKTVVRQWLSEHEGGADGDE